MGMSRDVCLQIGKKLYITGYSIKFQEKSPNMSLIPVLVQELLKIFFGGLKGPPGEIGLKRFYKPATS